MARLRDDSARQGRLAVFERLAPHVAAGTDGPPYRQLAVELGLTPGALEVAVHRLRRRFAALLRAEIAATLSDPADVDDELRCLFDALASPADESV
jgi:RNA polymerase sigma-70 factor (ECF subfamily)